MTRAYLAAMFAVLFCDLFDKFAERYGLRIKDDWTPLPDKPIIFGVYEDVRIHGLRRDVRFLFIKIPFIKTWGYIPGFPPWSSEAMGFRSHKLRWIDNYDPLYGGWRIDPPLEG